MLADILQNEYVQLILAVSTILGGIVAYKQLFSNDNSVNFTIDTSSIDKSKENQEPNEINYDLGLYGTLNKNYFKYNQNALIKTSREKIKEYICPTLNNQPTGADEFERQESLENIDKSKNEILTNEHILKLNVDILISEYDFQEDAYHIEVEYMDYTTVSLGLTTDTGKYKRGLYFSIFFNDKNVARKWKNSFFEQNYNLIIRNETRYVPSNMDKRRLRDTAHLIFMVDKYTEEQYYDIYIPTLHIKTLGFKFDNLLLPTQIF